MLFNRTNTRITVAMIKWPFISVRKHNKLLSEFKKEIDDMYAVSIKSLQKTQTSLVKQLTEVEFQARVAKGCYKHCPIGVLHDNSN